MRDDGGWARTFAWAMAIGFVAIFAFALQAGCRSELLRVFAIASFLAGASLAVGSLIGLLFGIPRVQQVRRDDDAGDGETHIVEGERYVANTNLERLSDWLTGIIVGVSLIQADELATRLNSLAVGFGEAFRGSCGPATGGREIAIGIMAYFAIAGFLFAFLWTRVSLPRLFTLGDLAARIREVKRSETKLSAREQQAQQDARALSMTQRYLEESYSSSEFSVDDLKQAIGKASANVKSLVFFHARKARSSTPKRDAAAIFEALVESDPDRIYHRNRAQLAYALKDRPNASDADLRRAVDLLTEAIAIRDREREPNYQLEEFNRAICHIRLDPDYRAGNPSTPANQQLIRADLDAAAKRNYTNDDVAKWLVLNPSAASP